MKDLSEAKKDLTIAEIMKRFGKRGLALATLFFIAPFLQPIPLPGISTPFGILIGLSGIGIAFSASVWLPKRVANTVLKSDWICKIGGAAHYVISRVEKFSRPRATHLVQTTRFFTGFLLFSLGTFLALPLILPFSNFIPAVIIFILAIGLAEEDFLFILLGYILFALSATGLYAAADIIIKWLKEYSWPF
ncbi:MAG: exopolysaccharide biosynthesis protein, partial [Bdellovibrionota bacterium]